MANYVLKTLIRFEAVDDIEARETAKPLIESIKRIGGDHLQMEFTVRKDGTDHVVMKDQPLK